MRKKLNKKGSRLLLAAVAVASLYMGQAVYAQGMDQEAEVPALEAVSEQSEEQAASEIVASGTLESGTKWELVGTTLTISGKDVGCSEYPPNGYPWNNYRDQIERVVLDGVEQLGRAAFANCTHLSSIVLNEGLKDIRGLVFENTSLKELILPSTVKSIGLGIDYNDAFGSKTLENIYVDENNPYFSSVDGILYNKEKTKLVRYPMGKKDERFEIPSSVRSLETHSLFRCAVLTEIVFPVKCLGISSYWCRSCDNLKKLTILNRSFKINSSLDFEPFKTVEVVAGHYGSTAQEFAKKYHKQFIPLNECTHKNVKETVTTAATLSKNGRVQKTCKDCGKSLPDAVIYAPKTIKLSAAGYTYNGKTRHPSISVKGSDGKVIAASNYTVAYPAGCKNVGGYTVRITFKGKYSGKATRSFTIRPKGTRLSRLDAGRKELTVRWKRQATQTTGYQIQYSLRKDLSKAGSKTVTVKDNKKASTVIRKLNAKKRYYVRIRTYKNVKTNGKSRRIYSAWSDSKSVTIKK